MDMAVRILMVCKNSCQIFEMLFSLRPYKDIFEIIALRSTSTSNVGRTENT